jgi:hypothetical protein
VDQIPDKKIGRRIPKDKKKPGGQPTVDHKIEIKKLKDLMKFKPTLAMTAGHFDVSKKTIERFIDREFEGLTFKEFREHNMANVKVALINKAITMALHGNTDMLKYCINNMCGWAYNPTPDLDNDPVEDMEF